VLIAAVFWDGVELLLEGSREGREAENVHGYALLHATALIKAGEDRHARIHLQHDVRCTLPYLIPPAGPMGIEALGETLPRLIIDVNAMMGDGGCGWVSVDLKVMSQRTQEVMRGTTC
jgi:hypothetical protein